MMVFQANTCPGRRRENTTGLCVRLQDKSSPCGTPWLSDRNIVITLSNY